MIPSLGAIPVVHVPNESPGFTGKRGGIQIYAGYDGQRKQRPLLISGKSATVARWEAGAGNKGKSMGREGGGDDAASVEKLSPRVCNNAPVVNRG
jgi:hypothetical protein